MTAALIVLSLLLVAYWSARTVQARKWLLGGGTLVIGLCLSYSYMAARRLSVLIFLLSIVLIWFVWRATAGSSHRRRTGTIGIVVLVLIFIALKWTGFEKAVYSLLHLPGRYLIGAGAWLGASYILFRLIHVLLEARKPSFPAMTFYDLFLYTLFPPTLIAGPIDRFPRFRKDETFECPPFPLAAEGCRRIAVGIFKKFVVADFIGLLPLDLPHAGLSTLRMWASLYLFGFQLFFDFAGYSDIAIGIAALFGFHVPENFNSPYLQRNITRFWQSWHATLSSWMRDYIFFPLGRALKKNTRLPSGAIVILCDVATMVLIGLWHGFVTTFALWGIWHGIGLFFAKKWNDRHRGEASSSRLLLRGAGATFVTFQFVMVSWVFFYSRTMAGSWAIFRRLLGMG